MVKEPGAANRSVVVAGLVLAIACAGFAAAFYFFDGAALVEGLLAGDAPQSQAPAAAVEAESADAELSLPDGMSEEFALRVWQEQVDSQRTITQLVEGDVKALTIEKASVDGDSATLRVAVEMQDGSSLPGEIGMSRFGETWYVAYVSARRDGGKPDGATDLPSADEVDVALLNTIMEQTQKNAEVTSRLANGEISKAEVESVKPGPNTATIRLKMVASDGETGADLIAITQEVGGEQLWFLARFETTASDGGK